MKLPGGWRWGVAAGLIALAGLILWYQRGSREPRLPESVVVRPVPPQPDGGRNAPSRERPERDRGPRPE